MHSTFFFIPSGEQNNLGGTDGKDSLVSFDSSAESTPRKSSRPRSAASTPQTPSRSQDLSLVDMKTSWDGSAASGGSTKGETTDGDSGYKIPFKHRGREAFLTDYPPLLHGAWILSLL